MSGGDPRQPCDLVIAGGLVITFDDGGRIIDDGAIAISGGRISAIGPRADIEKEWQGARVISGRDRIVMPGLVNSHNHTPLMATRGMIEDLGFAPMYTAGIPQGHRMSAADAHAFSRLAVYDLLRSGCTTIVDNYRYPEECARAIAEIGARGIVAGRIHDAEPEALAQGRYEYDAAIGRASLDENIRLAEMWDGHDGGRIRCDFQPHAPDTCSDALLAEVARTVAGRRGNVHTHLAQSAREVEVVKARSGRTPAEALEEAGLLDARLLAAHCIFVDDEDIARLGRAGIGVAHAPIGNAKSATVAPIMELAAAGCRITLCTDAACNDLFEAMRWSIAMQRVRRREFVLSPLEVLRWSTRGAAEVLGLGEDVGRLEPGMAADIILLDATSPSLSPVIDGYGILVHGAMGGDVDTAIVGGRVLLEGGVLLTADGPAIVRQAQSTAARLWSDAGRVPVMMR